MVFLFKNKNGNASTMTALTFSFAIYGVAPIPMRTKRQYKKRETEI